MNVSTLVVLAQGFEEIEALAPVDILRRAGIIVTMASVEPVLEVTGRSGITVSADTTFAEAAKDSYDLLFLPGGPAVKKLRQNTEVIDRIRRQVDEKKWIAAICAAPVLLKDAGVLDGRKYTAHFSVADELPDLLEDRPVVEDGIFLTSRGAGTAVDFGLYLVGKLCGEDTAKTVKSSICHF